METKIVVPALGESVVEATVARWLKKEGDRVQPGESLVELETDKVNLEVGAEKAGVLARIERKDGDDVKVGETLGVLTELPAEAQTSAPPQKSQPVPVVETKPQEAPTKATQAVPETKPAPAPKATPSARRFAQEVGVNLEEILGTGSGKSNYARRYPITYSKTKSSGDSANSTDSAAENYPYRHS